MAEITLEKAPKKARELFEKGNASFQRGNLDFAMDMYMSALEIEPAFLKARLALRAAMIKHTSGKGSQLSKFFGSVSGFGTIAKVKSMIAKKPQEALREAEKLLRTDPTNIKFIEAFDDAAMACNLPEAAAMTWEAAKSTYPKNTDILERLGRLYQEIGDSNRAKGAFEQLVLMKPNDQRCLKLLKDASAIDTMQSGGWEGAGSFRDVMKDEKQAQMLEQQARSAKSSKGIESLIHEAEGKARAEPQNINFKRTLAELYARENRFEEAIEILEQAQAISGGADPEVDRSISSIRVRHFDAYIQQLHEAGETAEAAAAEQEKEAFLFQDAQDRVKRYPNDLSFKFDLGVLYFKRGQFTEAIQQLQLGQRNPQKRIKALLYLALCFREKNQFEIAAEQLEKASSEIQIMDETKKEVLYELGSLYGAMGKKDKARDCFREIYTVDISYKDVAAKMEQASGG